MAASPLNSPADSAREHPRSGSGSTNPVGTGSHRRPYRAPQSRWWWAKNPFFRRYMLRDVTSVLVFAYSRVVAFIKTGWGALAILMIIALQLFHASHRIYHGLHDLHINSSPPWPALVFYGGATALSLWTAVLLFQLVLSP